MQINNYNINGCFGCQIYLLIFVTVHRKIERGFLFSDQVFFPYNCTTKNIMFKKTLWDFESIEKAYNMFLKPSVFLLSYSIHTERCTEIKKTPFFTHERNIFLIVNFHLTIVYLKICLEFSVFCTYRSQKKSKWKYNNLVCNRHAVIATGIKEPNLLC